MRNRILILTVFSALLFYQGCSDNLLDVTPQTEIGSENFFNTADDLDMYLNSLINWIGFSAIFIEQSDDATTSGNSEFMTIMRSDVNSRQISGGWNWARLRNINFFLENLERADISESARNHYEGVARFHRARFYYGMVMRFGDVPWYDKVLGTDDEDLYKPRDPRDYVVDRIFEDYEFAAQHVRTAADRKSVV